MQRKPQSQQRPTASNNFRRKLEQSVQTRPTINFWATSTSAAAPTAGTAIAADIDNQTLTKIVVLSTCRSDDLRHRKNRKCQIGPRSTLIIGFVAVIVSSARQWLALAQITTREVRSKPCYVPIHEHTRVRHTYSHICKLGMIPLEPFAQMFSRQLATRPRHNNRRTYRIEINDKQCASNSNI
jgi:hypothetical protein